MNPVSCKYVGHIADVVNHRIIKGEMTVADGRIAAIKALADVPADAPYYIPGFIDSHVHIESSMMLPAEFARIAAQHGSVGAICDPHEIANVVGEEGVRLMLSQSRNANFHFAFGVPSCVPACGGDLETSGAVLDSKAVAKLIAADDLYFLAEMMNFPGVLNADPEVMAKIQSAQAAGKPIDGHAPGLTGEARQQYAAAGISTDHECTSLDEGREAVRCGMLVQIRQGSAAKDYETLAPLIAEAPDQVMFCTDDSHPTDLVHSHIDRIVRRALADGYPLMNILQAACVNPVRHYNLNVGLLQVGDPADFTCLSDLTPQFRVLQTIARGVEIHSSSDQRVALREMYRSMQTQMDLQGNFPNKFLANPITAEAIRRDVAPGQEVDIIVASDGSLLTGHERGVLTPDVQKLVVLNRYEADVQPQVGYIKGFGLKQGAFAQTIAHDCHNIIAVGTDDEQIVKVINRIVEMRGGIAATDGREMQDLPLPIAGIMSPLCGHELAVRNRQLEDVVRSAGCPLQSPFITLGFMALPVIPFAKLTDKKLVLG